MYLSHLMYASRSVSADPLAIGQILGVARRRNRANDVTGLLLFDGVYFFQLLEGDRTVVSRLYHQIVNDRRHSDVVLLAAGPATERTCSGWSMGYVDDQSAIGDTVLRFSASRSFNPFTMTAASAQRLAHHIAANPDALGVTETDRALAEA